METSSRPHPSLKWWRTVSLVILCLALVAGFIAAASWTSGAERRAISRLAPGERLEVFTRTWQNFQELCAAPAKGLQEYCILQGRFLLNFSECDSVCHAACLRVMPTGRR